MGQHFLGASLGKGAINSKPRATLDLITFWRQSSRYWFIKNAAFDSFFRVSFHDLATQVVSGNHDDWLADPYGALALILMTDQYPRCAFRGTVEMYRTDAQAIQYARLALKAGYPNMVEDRLRLFFYLPFTHSEDLSDQRISVALIGSLGQPWATKARDFMEIINKFGRFPHRNEMLGRLSTQEEVAFLLSKPDFKKTSGLAWQSEIPWTKPKHFK
ncbi:MAG: DUF924 family protein [Mesorhizobium sp.]